MQNALTKMMEPHATRQAEALMQQMQAEKQAGAEVPQEGQLAAEAIPEAKLNEGVPVQEVNQAEVENAGNGDRIEIKTVNTDSGTETGSKFNFNKYLKNKIGDPPTDMVDPHAHHILFKEGLGAKQKALVKEGQELLRRYNIDPVYGLENLIWAPNRVSGQHSIEALKNVVERLKMVEELGGTQDYLKKKLIKALRELGERAATRR